MQADKWAVDNEMADYDATRLERYLTDGTQVLILAYEGEAIAGALLASEVLHPARANMLYIDEVDTHPDFRRKGIATLLMNEAFAIARERNLPEVWVSTETDNAPANALYRNLKPSEIEPSVIYTYKVE
jgi:ribosomal protein S18 acetylase RimI-like enzyme